MLAVPVRAHSLRVAMDGDANRIADADIGERQRAAELGALDATDLAVGRVELDAVRDARSCTGVEEHAPRTGFRSSGHQRFPERIVRLVASVPAASRGARRRVDVAQQLDRGALGDFPERAIGDVGVSVGPQGIDLRAPGLVERGAQRLRFEHHEPAHPTIAKKVMIDARAPVARYANARSHQGFIRHDCLTVGGVTRPRGTRRRSAAWGRAVDVEVALDVDHWAGCFRWSAATLRARS